MNRDVSVIIPFYNRIRYLPEAIESVLRQTEGRIQLILADDGSTDGSLSAGVAHFRSFAPPASRFSLSVIELGHSGLPGFVRNRAAEEARYPLLAFLDSDDLWEADKLERQLPLHQGGPGSFRISHTRERWLRALKAAPLEETAPDGQGGPERGSDLTGGIEGAYTEPDGPIGSAAGAPEVAGTVTGKEAPQFREISQKGQQHRRQGFIFEDALWKCIIGPSTVIMERALFFECGGFPERSDVAEDYGLWLRVTSREQVGYVDVPLTIKRAAMPAQDQLSERYGQIEGFRIEMLAGFLEEDQALDRGLRRQALEILQKKIGIYRKGAEKRGLQEETSRMDELLLKCGLKNTFPGGDQ